MGRPSVDRWGHDSDRVIALKVAGVQRVVWQYFRFRMPGHIAKPLVAEQSITAAVDQIRKKLAVRRIGLDKERRAEFAAWLAARDSVLGSGNRLEPKEDLGTDFEAVYGKLAMLSRVHRGGTDDVDSRVGELARHLEQAGLRYRRFVRRMSRLRDMRRRQVEVLLQEDTSRKAAMEKLDNLFLDALRKANEFAFMGDEAGLRR